MSSRHLSWLTFSGLVTEGVPQRVRVAGEPRLDLIVETNGSEIGLLLPSVDGSLPQTLAQIRVARRFVDGIERLYVSTTSRPLYQEFYHFMQSLADAVQNEGASPLQALHDKLEAWRQLLQRASRLSEEAEVGLFGELWVLHALLARHGAPALAAWTGPLGEPHDFRFAERDFEVKTTRRPQRIHTISTLRQLLPVPGKALFLISLQLQPAGEGGQTLPELVGQVRSRLVSDPVRCREFDATLEHAFAYTQAESDLYHSRFELRSPALLIPVDTDCPAITPASLASALCPSLLARVDDVRYAINVEGLGCLQGTPAFEEFLPISCGDVDVRG